MGIGDWGLGIGGCGVWPKNQTTQPRPPTPTPKK